VHGIDPSAKMLARARDKRRDARVHYERGSAEAIPLVSNAVDVVFMSMSFHHFKDRSRAALECRRILRDEGVLFVRTGVREQADSYAYVPVFSSARKLLAQLLPGYADLR
jgi:ubiquinone/menaquinone biosynthesis C-methylase UbiE